MKTLKRLCLTGFLLLAITPPVAGQDAPAAGNELLQSRNVRFDIVISDSGTGQPVNKNVTLNVIAAPTMSSSGTARIRANARPAGVNALTAIAVPTADGGQQAARVLQSNDLNLNVDVNRLILRTASTVRAAIAVEYHPYTGDGKGGTASVQASVDMIFEDGKRTVISQSADPVTDRRVVVEVTATISK